MSSINNPTNPTPAKKANEVHKPQRPELKLQRPLIITYLPATQLKRTVNNPRVHTEKQIGQLMRSIQAFGFNVPILVNGQLRIIAGHGRFEAANRLGIPELPTVSLEHLTEEQTKAFLIADNK